VFYAKRDTSGELIDRLKFEMPHPINRNAVAAVSEAYRVAQRDFGARLSAINSSEEGAAKHKP